MEKGKIMSKEELAAARDGGASFAALLEQYRPLLTSVTTSFYNRGREYNFDRDELFQEAQIALYNALCTYNDEQTDVTFGLYAKICMRNRLVSILRKAERANRKLSRTLDSRSAESDMRSLERKAAKEQLALLRGEIEVCLTRVERESLDGYLAGYSYLEIAQCIGCSAKTVDNALWRVKKKMRAARSAE